MLRGISRRRFLRYSALVAAAAGAGAPASAAAEDAFAVYVPRVAGVGSATVTPFRRVLLPRNLLRTVGTVFEDFEDVSSWAADPGTLTANTSRFSTGTQSIKLTTPSSDGLGRMTYALPGLDLSTMERLSFWLYLDDPATAYDHISVRLSSSDTPGDKNFSGNVSASAYFVQGMPLGAPGALHLVTLTKPQFTAIGGEEWTNPFTQLAFEVRGAPQTKVVHASFDNLRLGDGGGCPAVLLSFDDGYSQEYTNCFQYMQGRGLRGTVFTISDVVSTDGYVTWAQLREMQSAGWCIANHTTSPDSMEGLGEADQQARIAGCMAQLAARGLTGGHYLAYPWGYADAQTMAAMASLGMLIGRGTVSTRIAVLPAYDLWNVEAYNIDASVSLATAKGLIDAATARKTIASLIFHAVGAGTNFSVADFQALMDYIATNAAADLITPITMDDYYSLTLGAVSVPVPS